ncbi:unnamed protein product [Chrysoparadoxa australica]
MKRKAAVLLAACAAALTCSLCSAFQTPISSGGTESGGRERAAAAAKHVCAVHSRAPVADFSSTIWNHRSEAKQGVGARAKKHSKAKRLTREQEIVLGMRVKAYMELQNIRTDLEGKLGREPTWGEWAMAAGHRDEVSLKEVLQEGSMAKDAMTVNNLGLVKHVVKSYLSKRQQVGMSIMPQDLVQEATLGLIRAVEKFDPERGYQFGTYANWWIRSAISKSLQTSNRIIRVPPKVSEEMNRVKRETLHLQSLLDRSPTEDEISTATGVTRERLAEFARINAAVLSLDVADAPGGSSGSGNDRSLGERIHMDMGVQGSTQASLEIMLRQDLSSVLQNLLEQDECAVIRMRYGLDDGQAKTLSECADAMRVSKQVVAKLVKVSMTKLRRSYQSSRDLELYLPLMA